MYQFYCLSFLRNMELDSVNTCFPENIDHKYDLKNGRQQSLIGKLMVFCLLQISVRYLLYIDFYISHAYLYSLKDISLANKSMQSFVFASVSSSKK